MRAVPPASLLRDDSVPELTRLTRLEESLRRARVRRDRLDAIERTSGASFLEGALICGVLRARLRMERVLVRRRTRAIGR